jgi:hypothetical protein
MAERRRRRRRPSWTDRAARTAAVVGLGRYGWGSWSALRSSRASSFSSPRTPEVARAASTDPPFQRDSCRRGFTPLRRVVARAVSDRGGGGRPRPRATRRAWGSAVGHPHLHKDRPRPRPGQRGRGTSRELCAGRSRGWFQRGSAHFSRCKSDNATPSPSLAGCGAERPCTAELCATDEIRSSGWPSEKDMTERKDAHGASTDGQCRHRRRRPICDH